AGYTADGKVILFVIDGRITESRGANLLELAKIMKGLGCVGAVNFDGGGSTGMVVSGEHLNDLSSGNRPVLSTLGIYKK
ncbi:MAG: phosphodiester glycosidase family protein, partial [Candidatus Cryptobacteroides sp.]